ncbi:alpha/beta-Hydrolase [Purpureocillium lavendulum]|uniref:Alpha/beta-Hydrolase n=1 Tax=Purpureocillium lavendulum TaxID=1247861 RepID=A0AB34FKP9_9HYPO|nr:alpha/beta-Hydrolase [Purpureocillium lavendulum]
MAARQTPWRAVYQARPSRRALASRAGSSQASSSQPPSSQAASHSPFASPRLHQTITLPDGRALGFAEYGDPAGAPLLYFHGFPSSRLEAQPVASMLSLLGVRLIALDRPGFGLSTPRPGRRIIDWADDVGAFARAAGIDRFAVLGTSGGGPYALACAHALPRRMVAGVGLFASGPPWEAGAQLMSRTRRAARAVAVNAPGAMAVGTVAMIRSLRWIVTREVVARRIDKWFAAAAAAADAGSKGAEAESSGKASMESKTTADEQQDQIAAIAAQREETLRIVLDEPFTQGAAAAVEELRLLSDPDWGFRLEDVAYDPVRIWHGVEDANAPIQAIRYLAERVPHAVLTEFSGDSHYTMAKHIEGAMRDLLADGGWEARGEKA